MNQDPAQSQRVLFSFLKAFLVPTLFNKVLMLYFGLHMAQYPGEGYGYGLAASITFLLVSMGLFIYKFKDVEDP